MRVRHHQDARRSWRRRWVHEEPSVPNVEDLSDRTVLWEGLVIAIEPFLCTGAPSVAEDSDGWTLRTPDRSLAAQFEHSVVVTRGKPLILTG
jgi:methionyl aminopeptidase